MGSAGGGWVCNSFGMSDAVRFGLVGYGLGGRVFHAPLLASAESVEFAGAATHAGLAEEAISLGLAVVVDKPFTMEAASARAVATAAKDAGVLLSVYQN